MGKKSVVVRYLDDDGQETVVVVRRATAEMDVQRWQLMFAADEHNKAHPEEPDARKTLRLTVYPDCIASVESVTGLPWPLDFDTFRELDGELVSRWLQASQDCNPGWAGVPVGPEVEKKGPS